MTKISLIWLKLNIFWTREPSAMLSKGISDVNYQLIMSGGNVIFVFVFSSC